MRRVAAESIGTAFLLAAVVGSGIMAERLTGDVALRLLSNTLATAAMLFTLIVMFGRISGAHFNPAVTLAMVFEGATPPRHAAFYVAAQILGGVAGVLLAHAMFDATLFATGIHVRTGLAQWLSEGVAAFGLVLTILGCRSRALESIAACVALYIAAAYWFTASTSFANPAVTLARALTPSFSGIRPEDAPAFVAMQILGACLAVAFARLLFRNRDA